MPSKINFSISEHSLKQKRTNVEFSVVGKAFHCNGLRLSKMKFILNRRINDFLCCFKHLSLVNGHIQPKEKCHKFCNKWKINKLFKLKWWSFCSNEICFQTVQLPNRIQQLEFQLLVRLNNVHQLCVRQMNKMSWLRFQSLIVIRWIDHQLTWKYGLPHIIKAWSFIIMLILMLFDVSVILCVVCWIHEVMFIFIIHHGMAS